MQWFGVKYVRRVLPRDFPSPQVGWSRRLTTDAADPTRGRHKPRSALDSHSCIHAYSRVANHQHATVTVSSSDHRVSIPQQLIIECRLL